MTFPAQLALASTRQALAAGNKMVISQTSSSLLCRHVLTPRDTFYRPQACSKALTFQLLPPDTCTLVCNLSIEARQNMIANNVNGFIRSSLHGLRIWQVLSW
jgi:acyl-CoA reductase-like NAD-dependent aldehyde dehydrogenase